MKLEFTYDVDLKTEPNQKNLYFWYMTHNKKSCGHVTFYFQSVFFDWKWLLSHNFPEL